MNNTKDIISGLNILLEKNYDAEQGYLQCSEKVDNPHLKEWFKNKYGERYRFGQEIKDEIKNLGGSIEKSGSNKALAHRMWIDFKTLFSMNSTEAVLEECERGEKAFINEYKEFLSHNSVPVSTRNMLHNQLNHVIETKDLIQTLEESEA